MTTKFFTFSPVTAGWESGKTTLRSGGVNKGKQREIKYNREFIAFKMVNGQVPLVMLKVV